VWVLGMLDGPIIAAISARQDWRHETWLKGHLHIGRRRFRIVVRNLSVQGAKVQGATLPRPGEIVELVIEKFQVSGTVIWERDWNRGIQFHERVSTVDIIEQPY
jgi:hypothetical protein